MRRICSILVVIAALSWPSVDARAAVPWTWPVTGPIVRGFDLPDDPYGAGHRGIDIAAGVGTVIVAPEDGVVTFAGKVGGRLFLTIDHGGGVSSTCSWLTSALVRKNDHVRRGQPVATTGWGHPEMPMAQLHFGVRRNGTYVDPMAYLGPLSVTGLIRLAPLGTSSTAALGASALGRMTGLAYPPPPSGRTVVGRRRLDDASRRGSDVGRALAAIPRSGLSRGRRDGGAGTSVFRRVVRRDGHR